jgi:hypothetical protein
MFYCMSSIPAGAKALIHFERVCGTAKAVPFQSIDMLAVSEEFYA